jgi:hypothetical protein
MGWLIGVWIGGRRVEVDSVKLTVLPFDGPVDRVKWRHVRPELSMTVTAPLPDDTMLGLIEEDPVRPLPHGQQGQADVDQPG